MNFATSFGLLLLGLFLLPVLVSGCPPYGRDGVPWYGPASGIAAPQASSSSRNADCQFRVTTSWAQLRNWAPYRNAPARSASSSTALNKFAPSRCAPDRLALLKFVPLRSAPRRSARDRLNPLRSSPRRPA